MLVLAEANAPVANVAVAVCVSELFTKTRLKFTALAPAVTSVAKHPPTLAVPDAPAAVVQFRSTVIETPATTELIMYTPVVKFVPPVILIPLPIMATVAEAVRMIALAAAVVRLVNAIGVTCWL